MGDFSMPSLGADMKTGMLVAWRVKAGDTVRRGDIIAEVETDKGLFEVEVFEDGVVDRLLVRPGRKKIPVGTVLATIRGAGAEAGPPTAAKKKVAAGRLKVSPAARRRAAELHVDLASLRGSGAQGAICLADVEKAAQGEAPAEKKPPEPASERGAAEFQAGMRRAIAAAMSLANREIPHYYLETEIDMSRALAWLQAENAKRPIQQRLLPAVLPLKAVARALAKVPELNGHWVDGRLQVKKEVHIGFAVALRRGGLVTPALHDVDRMSLDQLMAALGDLVGRTRAGRLRASEMTDATITVTNLGDLGVKTVYGVIYPPQVALVGFGRIGERPWAENGLLGVRQVLTATLAADHRATDGHLGAQFLEALSRALAEPEAL